MLFCFGGDGNGDVAFDGATCAPFFDVFSSRGVFGGVDDVTFEDVDDDDVGGVDDGGSGAGPFSFLMIYGRKKNREQ